MSKDDCASMDWRVEGYKDGKTGKPTSNLEKYKTICAKHYLSPDESRYLAGYQDGLNSYCMPENGYHIGLRGKSYNNICPPSLEKPFLTAFQFGSQIYSARNRIDNNSKSIRKNDRKLSSLKRAINTLARKLLEKEIDRKQLDNISSSLQNSTNELQQLQSETRSLELEIEEINSFLSGLNSPFPQSSH